MGKFNKIGLGISTSSNLAEAQRQLENIKNSNLIDQEKEKALKSHKKFVKTTIIIVLLVTLFIGITTFYGMSLNGDLGIVITLGGSIMGVIFLITYALLSRKIFGDWTKYNNIVDMGFDGLKKQEINKLKPNYNEELIIKSYKKKSLVSGLIFLLVLVIEFSIILSLEIAIYSPITIIITLIITGIWYVFEDTYQVEIHRIKSGYYKKGFGYKCSNCNEKINIDFNEVEKYDSLPRDKNGVRIIKCPKCNNDVQLYNFDNSVKDYKNYLSQIK